MQRIRQIVALPCLLASVGRAGADDDADADGANPVEKTIQLLTQLQSQLVQDGQNQDKAYQKFFQWCDDSVQQKIFEIKTANREQSKLEAAISEANSEIDNCNTAIEELSSEISTDEEKLKKASTLRGHETEDFSASEKELMDTVDMLDRAIGVLEKEMKKGASFVQGSKNTKSLEDVLVGLTAIVDGASLGDEDKEKLAAFIEEREDAEDEAEDSGTLTLTSYKGSSSIIDTMEDLRDKAESQLRKEREEEAKAKHNFELLEQALKASIEDGNKDLDKEKASLAGSNEAKATAEGNLAVTKKLLEEANHLHEEIQSDCMQKAGDHEITGKGRAEELGLLAKVKKIVQASMTGFVQQPPSSSASFLQVSSKMRARTGAKAHASLKSTGGEVAQLVSKLASEQKSKALSKLASKISAVLRLNSQQGGSDDGPFEKVKGLVQDMIAKLEKEASSEAAEKAYCDEQLKITEEKKADLEDTTEGLKARIDEAASQSATLKGQVKELQGELAELAKLIQDMDGARAESKAGYENAVADLNKGLVGIRMAIKLLREYYASDEEDAGAASMVQTNAGDASTDAGDASNGGSDGSSDASFDAFMQMKQPAPPEQHEKSAGAGGGIVGMLQVIESDLAKNLAEQDTEESSAVASYEAESHENSKTKATKEQDVLLKTGEFKSLDKMISDQSSDLDTSSTELDSILDYQGKLKERCIAKADPYEERKKRRDAEINGLTEAMNLLGGEGAFLQRRRQ